MGYILKENKTYSDKYGEEHTTAYAAVDDVINCKRKKEANIILKIYSSKDSANNNKLPFESISVLCKNHTEGEGEEAVEHNEYDEYLSPSSVTADDNEFKQAYLYIDNLNMVSGGFKREDWQSDEV